MTPPARGTLALRLYAVGVVQLVLLIGAVIGVGWLLRTPPPEGEPPGSQSHYHRAQHVEGQPPGDRAPPPEMREPGAPGEPPPGPPPEWHGGPPPETREPGGPPGPGGSGAPPARIHHAWHHGIPIGPLLTLFLSGLVILGIGAFFTARWIVGPLHRLNRAAHALGEGDLSARTGLKRKDEIGQVGQAFDEMAERIQKLLTAEKELMANVSHELRTPLARIRVALDIAGEGDADMGRLSMTEIGTDLAELETLIDDILTATRLAVSDRKGGASHFEMHAEDIGAEVIAARAADRFKTRHPRRPFSAILSDSLPRVSVDPVLFRRVLDNLLENADKYSPDPDKPIALRVDVRNGQVAFSVEDEGLGIPEADLPHVFTPFFRGDRSRFRGTGGVGLGLTLASRIVEAHGGAIEVQSTVGQGSTFRVTVSPAAAT